MPRALRVYVSAPFAGKVAAARFADELEIVGFDVVSSWMRSEHDSDQDVTAEQLGEYACNDLAEMRRADLLVACTAASMSVDAVRAMSGGRHVELGYFLSQRGTSSVLLVGHPENAFHRLPGLEHAANLHQAVIVLARRLTRWYKAEDETSGQGVAS